MHRIAAIFLCLSVSLPAWGKLAPGFVGKSLEGEPIRLSEQLKEKRGLLLTFWASWCAPCMEELKHVRKHLDAHPDFPLDVLTVNVDTSETAGDVVPTMRMQNITFPVVADPTHEIFGKYHNEKTLPFSVLIDSRGNWVKTFNGYQSTMFEEITEALKPRAGNAVPAKS